MQKKKKKLSVSSSIAINSCTFNPTLEVRPVFTPPCSVMSFTEGLADWMVMGKQIEFPLSFHCLQIVSCLFSTFPFLCTEKLKNHYHLSTAFVYKDILWPMGLNFFASNVTSTQGIILWCVAGTIFTIHCTIKLFTMNTRRCIWHI